MGHTQLFDICEALYDFAKMFSCLHLNIPFFLFIKSDHNICDIVDQGIYQPTCTDCETNQWHTRETN